MNTESSNVSYGPTVNEIRLSRLSHPRATLAAMVMLAAVFLLFGMFAGATEPLHMAAPNTLDGAAALISDWAFGWSTLTAG